MHQQTFAEVTFEQYRKPTRRERFLDEIEASESGPHIAALFDFDGTIIAGYSATALLQEKFKRREMGP